jgi:hypothetical protein
VLYNRIMLDLETLGTRPGCAILSIGAVFFSSTHEEWKGPTFYAPVNRLSCLAVGLHEDPATVAWWRGQGSEARVVLAAADLGATPGLAAVLDTFSAWVEANALSKDVQVWGNGADFDNPILSAAYVAAGLPQPWGAYSGRCYRTLKALHTKEKLVRSGTHHNALDDAVSQAEHAVRILKALK